MAELKVLKGRIVCNDDGTFIYQMQDLSFVQQLMEILEKDEGFFILQNDSGDSEVISCEGKLADVKSGKLVVKGGN